MINIDSFGPAVGGVLKPGLIRTSLDILYVVVVGKLKKNYY